MGTKGEDLDNGMAIGVHHHCIADEVDGAKACGSSDALMCYEHEDEEGNVWYDAFCYSCRQVFTREQVHSSSLAQELGVEPESGVVKERKVFELKASKKERVTREQVKELWSRTSYEGKSYRGLSDEMLEFYGHRIEKDNNGEVKAVYYPETREGKIWGYKSRHLPKLFGRGNIGATGVQSDLSGQHKFQEGGRNVVIVGGESDVIAAAIMFRQYQEQKGQIGYNPFAVVSPTTGEPSAAKQCRQQYEWFDTFEVITILLDSDEVGRQASEDIAKVLPKDKVRIGVLSEKDPNAMLLKGRSKQFISDFFNAKPVVDSGIESSSMLMNSVKDALRLQRLPLPPEMKNLQEMTKGSGVIRNRIYNLYGDTSIGKSSLINSMTYYWLFQPDIRVGCVSLEATAGEYGVDLLSIHLGKNLYWANDNEVLDYLEKPEIVEKANELFVNDHGESRFQVLDDRTGTWQSMQKKMEQLHRQYGCNVLVVDVATDLLRTMSNEEQAAALNWEANFVKNGVTIFNVMHTRKPPATRDGIPKKPSEYEVLGSSIFVQKAAGNIGVYRNKNCTDDPIEQNTTYFDVPKMRQGKTGDKIMALYYDGETRLFHDRDQFFRDNPDKLPAGYDLSVSSFDKAYWEEGGRGFSGDDKQKAKYTTATSTASIETNNTNNGGEMF